MTRVRSTPKKEDVPYWHKFIVPSTFLLLVTLTAFILNDYPTVPPMDDTYIHLVFGNTLFTASPLSYNAGEPSSAFTSPLWLLPSALSALSGVDAAPVLLMLFSIAIAVFILFLVKPMTGILLLLMGSFIFHASSGMETMLACLFTVLIWKSIHDDRFVSVRPWLLLGVFLSRPELAVIAVPLIMLERKNGLRRIFTLLLPSLIAGVLWIIWNFHAAGLPLPTTFYAKFRYSLAGIPGLLKQYLFTSFLLPFSALAFLLTLRGNLKDDRNKALLAFVIIVPLVSFILQPNSWFQMRYHVPGMVVLALATGEWLRKIHRRKFNLALLVVFFIPGLIVFSGRRIDASADVNSIDVSPAVFLDENAAHNDTIAVADIGAMKWITERYLLDLDGLITPDMLPGGIGRNQEWILFRADWLAVFPDQYSWLTDSSADSCYSSTVSSDGAATSDNDDDDADAGVSSGTTSTAPKIEFVKGFHSPSNVICGEDSLSIYQYRTVLIEWKE